jgi:hypothetical protein
MPVLDWLIRRMRAGQEQEREVAQREVRTRATVARAHKTAERADRVARELEQLARGLR